MLGQEHLMLDYGLMLGEVLILDKGLMLGANV